MQQRLESSDTGRALISAFLIITLLAIGAINIPESKLRREVLRPGQTYLNATGLDQIWSVFARDPRPTSVAMEARIRYADGTRGVWHVPEGNDVTGEYWDYRWRKWLENVILDARRNQLWRPAAEFIAGRERAQGRRPVRVTLVRRWRTLRPPGVKGPDRGRWRDTRTTPCASIATADGALGEPRYPDLGPLELCGGGGAIETGMIGKDGAFGASQALDDKVSLNHVVVQVSGRASVVSSDRISEAASKAPALRTLLVKYEQFFLSQVQQTAACNAMHNVQSRTCKWLLRMHELAGPDLLVTQEFLAQMMGVRRTSVTAVASDLQKAGLISYARGRLHIIDLDQIRQWACECDADVRSHYQLIFHENEKPAVTEKFAAGYLAG